MATTNLPTPSADALPDDASRSASAPSKNAATNVSKLRSAIGKLALAGLAIIAAPSVGYMGYQRNQEAAAKREEALGGVDTMKSNISRAWSKFSDPDASLDELRRSEQILVRDLNGLQRCLYIAEHPLGAVCDIPVFNFEGKEDLPELLNGTEISPEEFWAAHNRILRLEKDAANPVILTNIKQTSDSSLAQGQE